MPENILQTGFKVAINDSLQKNKYLLILTGIIIFTFLIYIHQTIAKHDGKLDFFCESTLNLEIERGNEESMFKYYGTVLVRFKPDLTGYMGLNGDAEYNGYRYYISREISFAYQKKDIDGIFNLKLKTKNIDIHDNIPTELIEMNITGRENIDITYIVRHVNKNTYSIGNTFTPIIMCVDKL